MRALLTILFSAAAASLPACGQTVSFGFLGGTNLTRDFPISRTLYNDTNHPEGLTTFDLFSDTHSFMAGFSFEVRFDNSLSLEADALHRQLHLKRRFLFPDGTTRPYGEVSVGTWEWPILLKYRLPKVGAVRPFLEAGPSFRTRHNPAPTEPSQFGATIAAGAEFQTGRIRISPAIRYTRWQYDGDFPRFATKRDQIEFVTGISYATSLPSWNIGGRKLRFGVIGGAPLTGGIAKQSGFGTELDESPGYLGGLAVEVELHRWLSIEGNGLYRPFRAHEIFHSDMYGDAVFEFTVLTWEFPVLAKYRLRPASKLQPVVEAGPSFRLSGNTNGYNPSRYGVTAGGGFETNYRSLKFGSVLRYTRWAPDPGACPTPPPTKLNQVELLFSFTF